MFITLTTGLGALPEAVAKASGADVRVNAMVRELTADRIGWRLTVGSAADPEYLDADAVILATPAAPGRPAAEGRPRPRRRRSWREIQYASMAIITLAFRAADFPAQQRSGYLVPAVDGRAVKAATFSTVKWPHLAGRPIRHPVHIVRCSVGRSGDVAVLQRDDAELAALAAAELAGRTGLTRQPGRDTGSPAGAAGCRSTTSATWTGSAGSGPPSRRSPASPSRRRLRRRRHPGLHRHRPGPPPTRCSPT